MSGKAGTSKWVKIGIPVAVCVIVAAVLGGVLGSRASNNANSDKDKAGQVVTKEVVATSTAADGSKITYTTEVMSTVTSASRTSSGAAKPTGMPKEDAPLERWNWATDKSIGIAIGNWLVLERWMDEDWMTSVGGPDAWDEWRFCQSLGKEKCAEELDKHFSRWLSESDLDLMVEHGINHIRIPTGFWMWIDIAADEPYVYANQREHLERIVKGAHERGMYILLDVHGLPGSQNGEQHSGHNTTNPKWFNNPTNMARSDDMIKQMVLWIEQSPYRSCISGLEVINEPRPYTTSQNEEIKSFYERSYDVMMASSWPVTMFIHPAYIKDAFEYWKPFVTARLTDPPSLVITDHPYPGNFPPQNGATDIMGQICAAARRYAGYPIPVSISEWSIYTGIKTVEFEKAFYAAQAKVWSWFSGGMYWGWRLNPGKDQLAAGLDYSQYSFEYLAKNRPGVVPKAADFGLKSTVKQADAVSYIAALTSTCGEPPANIGPVTDGYTVNKWTKSDEAWAALGAKRRRRMHERIF